jgi:Ca2+-binding EF-hand superfamily protein
MSHQQQRQPLTLRRTYLTSIFLYFCSEFEVALMINTSILPDVKLSPSDAFDAFDMSKSREIEEMEFMEAMSVLGVDLSTKTKEENVAKEFHVRSAETNGKINLGSFKEIWVELVDTAHELRERGVSPYIARRAKEKNVRKLLEVLEEEEQLKNDTYKRVKMDALKMKHDVRRKKEEKKRAQELGNIAEARHGKHEQAKRDKAERMRKRREQEEKGRRQQRERELKKKADAARAERERQQAEEFNESQTRRKVAEIAEMRLKGEDRLDLQNQLLREMPLDVYRGPGASSRLAKLVSIDVSRNKLKHLPESHFLFWLPSLRKLDVSYNLLDDLPVSTPPLMRSRSE